MKNKYFTCEHKLLVDDCSQSTWEIL